MIFYFSATGNSYHVAKRLSQSLEEPMISIAECMKTGRLEFSIWEGERLGFVVPTYYLNLPIIVEDFIKSAKFHVKKDTYAFFVSTYGGNSGQLGTAAEKLLKPQGIEFSSIYTVKMPDSWTVKYDCSDKEALMPIVKAAEPRISEIIQEIQEGYYGIDTFDEGSVLTTHVYYVNYRKMNLTSHFRVDNFSCNGCGLCEEKCPDGIIKLVNDRPRFQKKHCTMCLACLHMCPKFAIQYEDLTKDHGQYIHPNVRIADLG